MFYNQTHHFLSKKFKKIFLRKSLKINFIAFLRRNFSKFFKFSKFFVNRTPSARGTTLLGAFGPQKWEHPPQPREKKFGRRHRKIAENRVFTVLLKIIKVSCGYSENVPSNVICLFQNVFVIKLLHVLPERKQLKALFA